MSRAGDRCLRVTRMQDSVIPSGVCVARNLPYPFASKCSGITTNPDPIPVPVENKFTARDVIEILREHAWLSGELSAEQSALCERAETLLGPHSLDRQALESLLVLIFHYDAREILAQVDSHVVMSRYAARDALRQLASLLLDPAPLTTDRFREVVDAV